MSVNSGYGGNVLLGKKCFALRIASYQGKNEGWMAEHMLILGIENPKGEIKYICRRIPLCLRQDQPGHAYSSRRIYKEQGYKVWCVGDDIAWMRMGADGRLWAINPENGFFGVAPGTNEKSNPNALASTKKDTIFTNVAHNPGRQHRLVGGPRQESARERASTGRATRGIGKTSDREGRSSQQPLHRSGKELPLHQPRV